MLAYTIVFMISHFPTQEGHKGTVELANTLHRRHMAAFFYDRQLRAANSSLM